MAQTAILARDRYAIIDVVFASPTFVATGANTQEVIELILTCGAVLAGIRGALVRLLFAVGTLIPRDATTGVFVEFGEASGIVLAWIRQALIGKSLTGHT